MNINKINGFTSLKEKLNRRKQDYFFTPEVAVKEQAVREIVFDVKARGDKAVKEYTLLFDKVSLKSLEVSKQQIKQAFKQVDNDLLKAMQKAYERIKKYHQKQLAGLKKAIQDMGGVQKLLPVDVAAVYAPGGRAFYPSSVLMTATLARVAGVKEVILLTPPSDNGGVTAVTLAAASIAGVDRVFAVGGAQGIAAVAFGTESLPKADVICGPGNIYVTLAKKAVYGAVNIDGLQGPSEAMIIADQTADAVLVASEILAQAEHDPLAQSVFITTSDSYYEQVMEQLQLQWQNSLRKSTIQQSLQNNGCFGVVANMQQAIELANMYAAEHLCLMFKDAQNYVKDIKNAGCVFVGANTGVEFGDYVVGPSHALPTGGSARFYSPLNINHFMKITDVVCLKDKEISELAPTVESIAKSEGLAAHAYAAAIRKDRAQKK